MKLKKLLGAFLGAIGLLIAFGAGSCTVAVLGVSIASGTFGSATLSDKAIILTIGAVPFIIGLLLVKLGKYLLR